MPNFVLDCWLNEIFGFNIEERPYAEEAAVLLCDTNWQLLEENRVLQRYNNWIVTDILSSISGYDWQTEVWYNAINDRILVPPKH